MIPEREEQTNYRRRLIEEKEGEMNDMKKLENEELEEDIRANRQKLNSELPILFINRIRALPLE